MKLILLGATGLVGRHLLDRMLADEKVDRVITPVRRPIRRHAKLSAPLMDFQNLDFDADFWKADAVLCALGSTMKKAGSREAFRFVDYELPMAIARLTKANQTPAWVLNSAAGANKGSSFFYNRVKADLEDGLTALDFPSLTIVRPGVIKGIREEFRPGERALIAGLRLVSPLLTASWHPVEADNIARAMLAAAINSAPGKHVIPSEQLL